MYNVEWRKQYDDRERDEMLGKLTAVKFDPADDLTVQSYKDDSDINVLMRRFGVTGQLPVSAVMPFYGDFSETVDYQTALNMVRDADNAFSALPAKVRTRFNNDPAELMAFLQNEENRTEAEELGLAIPKRVDPAQIDIEEVITPP